MDFDWLSNAEVGVRSKDNGLKTWCWTVGLSVLLMRNMFSVQTCREMAQLLSI